MFDRLGDCLDLHHMTDVIDRFDQGAMSRVLRESLNELAIDLDEIDGEFSQVGERAETATKVIENESTSATLEYGYEPVGSIEILHGRSLGNH